MSRMLLSIKPEYVEKILSGRKKYEFRKFRCRSEVDTIIIYSTAPQKCIVGEVALLGVIEGSVEEIWQRTKDYSGITKKTYKDYYHGRQTATAYYLGNIIVYDKPKTLDDFGLNYVPQSFAYIDSE